MLMQDIHQGRPLSEREPETTMGAAVSDPRSSSLYRGARSDKRFAAQHEAVFVL